MFCITFTLPSVFNFTIYIFLTITFLTPFTSISNPNLSFEKSTVHSFKSSLFAIILYNTILFFLLSFSLSSNICFIFQMSLPDRQLTMLKLLPTLLTSYELTLAARPLAPSSVLFVPAHAISLFLFLNFPSRRYVLLDHLHAYVNPFLSFYILLILFIDLNFLLYTYLVLHVTQISVSLSPYYSHNQPWP